MKYKSNMVNSKFKLAIVSLWNGNIHGIIPENEIPNEEQLSKYFINDSSINRDEFFDKDNYRYIGRYIKMMNNQITYKIDLNEFGNYYSYIFNNLIEKKIIGLQIIEPIRIGPYELAMIKTHWIRLIQRRWREIMKKRLQSKKNLFNLRYREIYGKYPDSCNIPFKLNIN